MKTDASTIKEIEKLLQAYEREVMLAQDHGYLQPKPLAHIYSTLVTL